MTNAELDILRTAAIGPARGERAGDHVMVLALSAAVSRNDGPWQRDESGHIAAAGWVDNLKDGTVMIYGHTTTWALRFGEIESVAWRTRVAT